MKARKGLSRTRTASGKASFNETGPMKARKEAYAAGDTITIPKLQ